MIGAPRREGCAVAHAAHPSRFPPRRSPPAFNVNGAGIFDDAAKLKAGDILLL